MASRSDEKKFPKTQLPEVPKLPTIQIFISQVREAREENVRCISFCMAFFALLLGSIWIIVLSAITAVPIVMIVIGADYLHDCPVRKMIPISVIVGGCVSLLRYVISFLDRSKMPDEASQNSNSDEAYRNSDSNIPWGHSVIGWLILVIDLFLTAWFVATCYWVYSVKPEFSDKNAANYCNPHLYCFVYWLLNSIFIFFGTIVLLFLLMMCYALMCF